MAPVVLAMDVHCDSCAKKIRKAVMKVPGAESVTASYETGLVMVHGTADAAALVARLQAKTKKAITIVSDGAEENGEAAASAGAGGSAYAGSPPPPPTILLEMELHCGSCAEKVERRVMEIPGVDTVTTDVPGRRVTVTGTADASAVATSLEVRMRRPVIVLSDPRRPDDAVPGYDHEQRKAAAAGAAAQQMWEMYGSTSTAHVAPQEAATDAASILSSLSSSSSSAPPPPPAGGRRRRGRACHRAPSPPPVQGAGSSSSMTPSFPPPPAPSYGAPPPPPGYGYYYPAPPPPGVYDGQNWAAPAPPPSGCFLMQQGGEMYGQQWPPYPPPAPEPPEGYYPYGGQQYCDNPGSCSIQ
ncbi:unnamed protein product [Urochloa decumbens]|uniref:HMA domain-containing protein n=1 Tax=Urochloa decumbens TaxID=240449 RepID=A0ABC9GVW2_9POAL